MSDAMPKSDALRIFALLKRRADLDVAAFSQHWRTRHAEAALKLTKYFERYVQNHLAAEPLVGFDRAFDGGAELWYPSWQHCLDLVDSEEYRSDAHLDNYNFQDVNAMGTLITRPFQASNDLARPPVAGAVKVIALWRRHSNLSAGDFRSRFMASPAPLLLPEGNYHAFERCIAEPAPGEPDAIYDAVEQLWWRTEGDFASDAKFLSAPRAGHGIVDRARSTAARVEELYIYWP